MNDRNKIAWLAALFLFFSLSAYYGILTPATLSSPSDTASIWNSLDSVYNSFILFAQQDFLVIFPVCLVTILWGMRMWPFEYHYHYSHYPSSSYRSPSSSSPPAEIEEKEPELMDAEPQRKEHLEVMLCPKCGGDLHFGDNSRTSCAHCGAEVRRVGED
jgi:hypothetical protein